MNPSPVVVRLAGVPVGKARPRFVRQTGRAFTPAHTRSYESALRYAAQVAMGDRPPLADDLAVSVVAAFPIPTSWSLRKQREAAAGALRPSKKPDADNLLKVCDALNEVVWRDDVQIVEASIRKVYSRTPELVVTVSPIGPPQLAV